MFGFLKKRELKDHMKIVAQNQRAYVYCQRFMEEQQASNCRFLLDDVNSRWKPGQRLSDEQFRAMWAMNSVLRRAYDGSPAKFAGMKAFDKEFAPLLGWEDYFSQFM